jgi:SAM-dependent methyltransferase
MHKTAQTHAKLFFDVYVENEDVSILEIGSLDVGGSIRSCAPPKSKYVGVDFVDGPGVDVVIEDPYTLPFDDDCFDICLASSVFEHSEFFWLLFNEILRTLKSDGLFYLNAPSNGSFHQFPVDCYRFYPDAGKALEKWSRRCGYNATMLESFVGKQTCYSNWNDFVAVFLKDANFSAKYSDRIQSKFSAFSNGLVSNSPGYANPQVIPEDQTGHYFRRLYRKIIRVMSP